MNNNRWGDEEYQPFKSAIYKQLKERNEQQTKPFEFLILQYQNLLVTKRKHSTSLTIDDINNNNHNYTNSGNNNYHLINVYEGQIKLLREQLQNSKEELSQSYQQNAKHAQTIIDYINKSKQLEERHQDLLFELQVEKSNKEFAVKEAENINKKYENLNELYSFIKDEYNALKDMISCTEDRLQVLLLENYDLKKENELLKKTQIVVEEKLLKCTDIINQQNDELQNLNQKLHQLRDTTNEKGGGGFSFFSKINEALPRRKSEDQTAQNNGSNNNNNSNSNDSIDLYNLEGLLSSLSGFSQRPPTDWCRMIEGAHSDFISQVCYNKYHGPHLASCSLDKTVKIWDSLSGNCYRTFNAAKAVRSIDFSMDNQMIFAGTTEGSVPVWDIKSSKLLLSLVGHRGKVAAGSFISTTGLLTGSHDRTLRTWDLLKGFCTRNESVGSRIYDLCVLPSYYYLANHDRSIRIIDPKSLKVIDRVECHSDIVTSITSSFDMTYLLTTSRDNTLNIIDTRFIDTPVFTLSDTNYVNIRTESNRGWFTPCGKFAFAGSATGSIFIWDATTGKLDSQVQHKSEGQISFAGISPNGNQIAVGTSVGNIVLWEHKN